MEKLYESNIDNSLANPDFMTCCIDVEYMRRCVEESQNLGLSFRILLCSTNRPEPMLGQERLGQAGRVLGFDVAYSGGSHYSCVLNDAVSGRIEEFRKLTLNENGLFATFEEAEAFVRKREELEKVTTEYIYEKGDYVTYKLTEVEV